MSVFLLKRVAAKVALSRRAVVPENKI